MLAANHQQNECLISSLLQLTVDCGELEKKKDICSKCNLTAVRSPPIQYGRCRGQLVWLWNRRKRTSHLRSTESFHCFWGANLYLPKSESKLLEWPVRLGNALEIFPTILTSLPLVHTWTWGKVIFCKQKVVRHSAGAVSVRWPRGHS